ncbi:facilitated trehalose transporter Tret1-like isoform X2 [Colias croceus]|uniref:facilitated trehalose transporter Tret1-like isoform X2 n=1 Tax=Colias crocea TaxID=72248 RepID=UPI001E27A003|nr:facilitated trehalose transporter Tret1-like isoform X2 [Colias croceus]
MVTLRFNLGMKRLSFFGDGSKINQIICAVLICLPIFTYGTCIGWMSPMTLLLQSNESPKGVPLTDGEISWMASLPYLSCVPATYLMAYLGDRLGRKTTLLFMSLAGAAIWLLKLCSMNIWVFIIARTLVGIIMAGSCVTCPTYIKEISEDSIRGALGCWGALFAGTGSLFAYIIGDLLNYTTILWVFLAIPVVHFVVFLAMPESPSYLVKKGKVEEAASALAWLRCRNSMDTVIHEELEVITKEQRKDEENKQFMLKSILTDKILSKAFQIALVAALSREVCGAVPVLNFAGDIFNLASKEDTGLVLSPNQQAMMLGVVQLSGSLLASSVVERCGRKKLMIITCLASGLSMCLLATWFLITDLNITTSAWIPVITLCLCIFCDAAGLMPISVVITGEIFSYKYRGSVLATTMAIASIADFFQLLFFKPLAKSIGVYAAFYFFGTMCLLTALYVIFSVPETRNRSLEEIYNDLRPKKERTVGKKDVE